MISRPYAAAKRTLGIADKLLEVNWGLVLLITIIAAGGIAMLYSVAGGHFHPWALSQLSKFLVGLVILVVAASIDVRVWMSLAYPAYAVALLLLIAVDVAGHAGLGAQRWIMLGPVELQPSELMKVSLVLALARFLHGKSVEEVSKPLNLAIGLAMIGIPALFVVIEPNLGTTLIIVADGCSLLFLAGLSWYWITPALAAVATAVPLAWRFVLHDYQKARVMTFLNPETDALGAGWNITQAKIAIGSGGLSGKGFLNGTQSRLNFLPEKQTDFIFTNFGEEFGFVGSVALLDPVRGGDLLRHPDRHQRAQPILPPAGHGHHPEFLLLHHDQRPDGDGTDPGGGHSHAAPVLWRNRHADGDVRLRPVDERACAPAGGDTPP